MSNGTVSDAGAYALFAKRSAALAATVLAAALVAWLVAVHQMRGMRMGPTANLGGLGWYVGMWVTMMAAMMLPSVLPMVLLFAHVTAERTRRGRAATGTPLFVAGYLGIWTLFGILAYGVARGVRALDLGPLQWDSGARYVVAATLAVAAVYQVTPLKHVCLRHCRSPLEFVLGGWREGRAGAVWMGVDHGAWCIGCCWALMLALFALGVMSIAWMVILAGVIFVEKVLPGGGRSAHLIGLAFAGLAVWSGVSPGSVPFLIPSHMAGGQM
jgi:predicted metal-binding membrane protein